jgi:GNAT superfamily N-acetyltransferase
METRPSIEIWNNVELQQHLKEKEYETYVAKNRRTHFKGFQYFGPNFSTRPAFDGGKVTFKIPSIEDFTDDRTLVALEDSNIVGLFSLRYGFYNYTFQHYYPRILEVRDDKRNQGIATSLIKRLKEPCFLHGDVFMIRDSSFTSKGRKYLKDVFERELKDAPFRVVDGWFTHLEDYDTNQEQLKILEAQK